MRMVSCLAALAVAASCSSSPHGTSMGNAPAAPPVAGSPAASKNIDDERAADEGAYRFLYLPEQARLTDSHRGEWLAIVEHRIVPTQGELPAPAKTMEAADAAARAAAPSASHRFLFQIGEEGDIDLQLGGCELQHVMGNGLLALLQGKGVEMRNIGPGERIQVRVQGALRELTVVTPDENRMYLKPEVGPPGAKGEAKADYCLATGFAGFATMAPATASGLELWEIPGTAHVKGALQSGECRRARARFSWPNTPLDLLVPVAVWPK
jgi:hypothetical protein